MNLEQALPLLRQRYHVKREPWRSTIGWPPGSPEPLMFWPSGFVEAWRPTLRDVVSDDLCRATGDVGS